MTLPAALAEYNADEASGDVLDTTGNGHGFPLGSMTRVAGQSGHGSALTAGGIVNGPAMFGQTTQRTLAMWLKLPGTLIAGWAFEWHLNTGDTGIWGLLCLNGNIGFRARNAAGTLQFASIPVPTDAADHHYAGTFDGSVVRLYVDGALAATTLALSGGIAANADVLRVFDVSIGTPPVIDDIRVYDVALTAAQVVETMAAVGTAPPAEDHSGSLSLSGSGSLALSGTVALSGALSASGSGSYTAAASPAVSGAVDASGAGTLASDGSPAVASSADLTGSGALDAVTSLAAAFGVDLAGSGAIAASGSPAASGSLALSGVGSLAVAPHTEAPFVDLTISAALADDPWAAALDSDRWSAVIESDPWTGGIEA